LTIALIDIVHQSACLQCKERDKEWTWVGCWAQVDQSRTDPAVWKRVKRNSWEISDEKGKTVADLEVAGLRFSKHIDKLPPWVLNLPDLKLLDLEYCGSIETLPLNQLLKLDSLMLKGCTQLWNPPQEICNQEGKATMEFLRQIKEEGEFSREMNLFLIGDGEAGKTSLINALIDGRAEKIRRDYRTVGIDLKEWQPYGWDCSFHIYDLAGQAVYSKTHQIFLVRRAVYIFVWRALAPLRRDASSSGEDDQAIFQTISYWLHALQNRMPGSYFMMVVTHIDEVESSILLDQCKKAKQHVQKELESIRSAAAPGVPILQVYNGGESIRVNSLQGDGVSELRQGLKAFVHQMPWYPEPLPKSWIEFRKKLRGLQKKYIDWRSDYLSLAHSCEVKDEMLKSATKFLHDTGSIRYFDDDYESGLVYLSTSWMMSVMKGLIRHNRQTLADYFLFKQDKERLALVSRLELYGRLDRSLLPYLWPGLETSEDFWQFSWLPKKKAARERKLWQESEKLSGDFELEAALALLVNFDLICMVSDQIIVPGILPPGKLPGKRVAGDTDMCPNRVAFYYEQIPMGAIEAIMVRLIRRHPEKQADFTSYIITLCDKDSIAQVFIAENVDLLEDSKAVSGTVLPVTIDGGALVVRSSSKTWLKEIESDVDEMEKTYPGLKRKDRMERISVSNREAPAFWNPRDDPIFVLPVDVHLAEREVPEMRKCPLCSRWSKQEDEDCNGSFDAGECRIKALNDPDRGNMIMTCRCCIARGDLGLFRLLDIANPDVVILGMDHLDPDSKAKTEQIIKQIEIQASVICVEPKLDAGAVSLKPVDPNELTRIESFECWELWTDQASLAIVFMTDQCLLDPSSKYKLQRALRAPKYIFPILTTAWSGSRDAAGCSQELENVVGKPSGLKYFDPIDLQLNTDQNVITTIVEQLNLQIKRTGQSEYFSDFSSLGVKLSFFEKFIQENNLRSPENKDLATDEVMTKFVKSRTEDTKLSYCEHLKSKGEGRFVGPSDWFYSHAWKFRFLDVVDAAKEFFMRQYPASDHDPIIWFDVFSVSQHKSANRSFEWWNSVFLGAVGDIGRVLIIIPPFEQHTKENLPAWFTVRRAWCVFELLACILNDCELEMVMPKSMRSRLTEVNDTALMESLSRLDCRESEASVSEDRERIFGLIKRSVGFDQLNRHIKAKAEEWIRRESGAWLAEVTAHYSFRLVLHAAISL
jgi:GTPase SAR1 family protein